jgi:mitochondrial fission protein ELM1
VSVSLTHILIIDDGKAGHLNQSLGLAEALAERHPGLGIETMRPLSRFRAILVLIFGFCPGPGRRPKLIIGAGHGTHLTLLALKRYWRTPIVVMMKPSAPLWLFDLCLIPEHDYPPKRPNVVTTSGALNRVRPASKRRGQGMILIGGPSKNSGWDESRLVRQVEALAGSAPCEWLLTTSRRTPVSTLALLRDIKGIRVFPSEATPEGWLPEKLAETEQCWVTEDSVSMIYEALSAGCSVGVFEVPWRKEGRLLRGLNRLKERGILTSFECWSGGPLPAPEYAFNEARRCAEIITDRELL